MKEFAKKFDLVITPYKGLVPLELRELWEYRTLIWFLIGREWKARYRQTALGPLWMVLDPLVNMALFVVVFGIIARMPSDGLPYPLFNFAAILPWNLFAGCVLAASTSLLNYRPLISKIYFPRLSAALVGAGNALIDFAITAILLVIMSFLYGYVPAVERLYLLPVALLIVLFLGIGVGLWFSAWVVHFHDVSLILNYLLRVWMYSTPIVYAASIVPEKWRSIYYLNPMAHAIDTFRWSLFGAGQAPGSGLWLALAFSFAVLVSGAYYFKRSEINIVDIA